MQTSSKGELWGALAKAQSEFPAIPKDASGHGYRYAKLDTIQRLVRPVLAKNGLGFTQHMRGSDMVTILFHQSGQTHETTFPLAQIEGRMNAMQKMGAVSTYAARYGLCLTLGISADEDTDATGKPPAPQIDEDWNHAEFDGRVVPRGAGADAGKASKEELAKQHADKLMALFKDAKTQRGLDGAWSKHQAVIDRLQASYDTLYQSVFDAYMVRQAALNEEKEAAE